MAEKIVLCRRDVSDFGEAARFCSKSITTPNASNLCDDCRKNFPLWPKEDAPAVAQEAASC